MPEMTAEQRAKLPKFARTEIARLEREVDELQELLAAARASTPTRILTDVYARPMGRPLGYLPSDLKLRFALANEETPGVPVDADETRHSYIDVCIRYDAKNGEHALELAGDSQLVVAHYSSNLAQVRSLPFRQADGRP